MIKEDMHLVKELSREKVERVPTRNGFGEGLVLAGEADENVVALCADLTGSTRMDGFKDKFPERYLEVGVAEQNLVTVASGLAAVGKNPFVSSYAAFAPGRCWEQIRTTICYNDQKVNIVGSHAGVSVGPDGATHQMLEDLAIMRALPNMTVMAPCDVHEARRATVAAAKSKGPVYIRFAREATPVVTTEETPFEIGKAQVYREGKGVTIVACGPLVYEALLAAEELDAEVINCATIKPIDRETIVNSAKKTGRVVTAEEHQITGGLGGAVAEVLGEDCPVPMRRVAVLDRFGESGEPEELMDQFKLRAGDIVKAAKEIM